MRIIVVEDDASLREGILELLRGAGHDAEGFGDAEGGVRRALEGSGDLVLLDVLLPGMDGFTACRTLREQGCTLPVLMLTALGSEEDTVCGLEAGADDFVVKPFGARALLARVDAVARRSAGSLRGERLVAGGCEIDLGLLKARRDGREHALSAREADIIRYLISRRGQAAERGELLQAVWHVPSTLRTRAVDMAIATLRKKIEADPAAPRLIVSAKGRGYAWGAA